MSVVRGLSLCGSTVEAPGPGWVSHRVIPVLSPEGRGSKTRRVSCKENSKCKGSASWENAFPKGSYESSLMAEVRIPEAKDEAGDEAQARWCRAVKSGQRVYVVMAATEGSTCGSGAATRH